MVNYHVFKETDLTRTVCTMQLLRGIQNTKAVSFFSAILLTVSQH
jgi:hypothetical protein